MVTLSKRIYIIPDYIQDGKIVKKGILGYKGNYGK
jgi:hypothetical protein